MNAQPQHTVIISPLGDIDDLLLKTIRMQIDRIFAFGTEIRPLLKSIEFAHDTERDQYYSTQILQRLDELAPSHALKVLAVVQGDLFIPILTHVYGEAQLGGRSCVVSTHRLGLNLPPSGHLQTYQDRISKETIHELAHTFSLRHCKDRACIMHYCRSIRDVDQKSHQLCRYCRTMLADELRRLETRNRIMDSDRTAADRLASRK